MPTERPLRVLPVTFTAVRMEVLSGDSTVSPSASGGAYEGAWPMRRE